MNLFKKIFTSLALLCVSGSAVNAQAFRLFAVYVQTNPIEHGTVENRSVVELTGWAEPGTEITVNGIRLPVNNDGMFMERYLVYVGDKLVIKASNGKDEKVLMRNFNIIK